MGFPLCADFNALKFFNLVRILIFKYLSEVFYISDAITLGKCSYSS